MPERSHTRLNPPERREQIIIAATKIISDKGYWGFSVRQVAEACGLTEPAVIYHFKNKVGLFIAVLEHRDTEDMTAFANSLGVSPDEIWSGKVKFGLWQISNALMARNATQPEIIRLYTVLQAESLSTGHPAHDYYLKREQRVMLTLTQAAQRDNIANPVREARTVLSMMDGLQLRWLEDSESFDLLQEWKAFAKSRWGQTTKSSDLSQ